MQASAISLGDLGSPGWSAAVSPDPVTAQVMITFRFIVCCGSRRAALACSPRRSARAGGRAARERRCIVVAIF